MAPELQLRPDRLRLHAAVAAALADELDAALDRPAPADPEIDRLRAQVRQAAARLAELSAGLRTAAGATEQADAASAGALTRLHLR